MTDVVMDVNNSSDYRRYFQGRNAGLLIYMYCCTHVT